MSEFTFVAAAGALVVLSFLYLHRREGGAASMLWAWAWLALWISGLLVTFEPALTALRAAGVFVGSLFPALLLAGALAFEGRPRVERAVLAGAAFGGAGATSYVVAGPAAGFGVTMALDPILAFASAWVVWRAARLRRANVPERLLGPAFLALAALVVTDGLFRISARPTDTLVQGWVLVSLSVGLLQIMSISDRLHERAQKLLAERREQAALLDAERRTLRAVIEAAPVGIMVAGRDECVTMVNRAMARHFELGEPERLVGASFDEMVQAALPRIANAGAVRESLADTARSVGEAVAAFEVVLEGPDERILVCSAHPVLSESGEQIARLRMSRDVTEERRLEEELRQAQKMETIGRFAGGVAHDFNNQLTVILANARLAEEALPEGSAVLEGLRDAERAAEHCAELTRGILAFSRRAPFAPRAVDPKRAVEEAANLLRAALPTAIEVRVEAAPDVPHVRADPSQLQQVLMNLVVNARDALPGGGRIVVAAAAAPAPRFVELRVSDDGVGMEARTRERIFEPFFTTKPPGKGTGLGLSIVYGIVEAHGGRLMVESEPGAGTTVRVWLPVAEGAAAQPEPPRAAPAAPSRVRSGRGRLVLVAEDEAAVLRLVRRTLEQGGHRVLAARDGEEAVRLFLAHRAEVDAVVLDVAMPRRGGAAALRAIRSAAPGVPAIVTSGNLDEESAELASLAAEFLPKPFSPEALVEALERILRD